MATPFILDPFLRILPDPILRTPAREVVDFDEKLRANASRMQLFMEESEGIGIAAQQCGLLSSLVLVRHEDKIVPLVNPKITEHTAEIELEEEACLSLPRIGVEVPRHAGVRVEAKDLEGEEYVLEATGMTARIVQHEIDHLHGRLIMDYVSGIDRLYLLQLYAQGLKEEM